MANTTPAISTLSAVRARYDIVIVCVVLSLIILTLDLLAPMGIASGALYVTVVLFSLIADNAKITMSAAAGLTLMILAGMAAAHFFPRREIHEAPWILLVNRAVALTLIWLAALLGARLLRIKRQVVEHGQELERMNLELNKLARHDALTNVANRRYFDERLSQEILRAIRDKSDLSLLMIDVDWFKKFNDVNGHQAGDACLIQVAQTIQANLRRPGDMAARYGGEEFAVILPATGPTGAVERAEMIRKKVEALHLSNPGSHKNTSVTVSIGVASFAPGDAEMTPPNLIKSADHALYQVKQSGRNAVKISDL